MKRCIVYSSLFLFVACGLSSGTAAQAVDYFPLRTGSEWTYTTESSTAALGTRESTLTVRIEGQVTHEGKEYLLCVVTTSDGFRVTVLYRVAPDGIYERDLRSSETGPASLSEERLFLPSSLDVGKEWKPREITNRVEGYETVHLPTATYDDCLKISHKAINETGGVDTESYSYYARGVGLVKSVSTNRAATYTSTMMLDRYTPPG